MRRAGGRKKLGLLDLGISRVLQLPELKGDVFPEPVLTAQVTVLQSQPSRLGVLCEVMVSLGLREAHEKRFGRANYGHSENASALTQADCTTEGTARAGDRELGDPGELQIWLAMMPRSQQIVGISIRSTNNWMFTIRLEVVLCFL